MPTVSIIIPCYNEEKTIHLLLEAISRQTYPVSEIEVVIADGMSTDRTRSVIHNFQTLHPNLAIKVVDNVKKNIPAALNKALDKAVGQYIIRLDAHSAPAENYVELCVRFLSEKKGDNVGGIWKIKPGANTLIGRAIAAAAANPFGVGDALYRFTSRPGYVDTVPFGSFSRELFDKIGCFDESLLTNEDYEFNTRLRLSGGKVYLDPQIQSDYYARSTLTSLSKQYWRYGFWKSQMLRRYPATIRLRQALPPLFVLSIVFLTGLGLFFRLAWWVLFGGMVFYFFLLLLSAIPSARAQRDIRLLAVIPLAIITMHISWGAGLVWGLLYPILMKRRKLIIDDRVSTSQ